MPEEIINQEPVQNYKLGDEEYTPDELSHLVDLGKIGIESETKFNTKIDKVWQDYGRTKTQVKEQAEKIKDYEQKLSSMSKLPDLTEDDQVRQAKEAARKLGFILKEDMDQYGIVTKEKFVQQYKEQRYAEKLLDKMEGLETKIDGKDGRPRFSTEAMLEYMNDTGITDPEVAYKVRYDEDLTKWRDSKINERRPGTMYTEKPGSSITNKTPQDVKPNKDNLKELTRQALRGEL
jgi:hypothetical protein